MTSRMTEASGMKHKLGRGMAATFTAALACAAFASPASASLLTASASQCGDQTLSLSVSVELKTSLGLSLWVPVLPGDLGGGSWHPTAQMPLVVNDLTLSSTDLTPVRFRFTPLLGSWQIDDVYVDPCMKR